MAYPSVLVVEDKHKERQMGREAWKTMRLPLAVVDSYTQCCRQKFPDRIQNERL
jgi:hypothetical protein